MCRISFIKISTFLSDIFLYFEVNYLLNFWRDLRGEFLIKITPILYDLGVTFLYDCTCAILELRRKVSLLFSPKDGLD